VTSRCVCRLSVAAGRGGGGRDVMVTLEVQCEVIRARESSAASATCERLVAGVFAEMTS